MSSICDKYEALVGDVGYDTLYEFEGKWYCPDCVYQLMSEAVVELKTAIEILADEAEKCIPALAAGKAEIDRLAAELQACQTVMAKGFPEFGRVIGGES